MKECLEDYDMMKYSFIKRIKYNVIKKLLKGRLGKVLDIGSGGGFFTENLSKRAEKVVSIDILEENIEEARKNISSSNIEFLVQDATNMNFDDESFDTIIAADVIEHIERDDLLIKEISRVLKGGGRCVITSVCRNPSINLKFLRKWIGYDMASAWGHVREGYSKRDFYKLVKNSGLRIVKVEYSVAFFGEILANLSIIFRKKNKDWESGRDLGKVKKSNVFKVYKVLFPLFYGVAMLDNLLFFLRGNKIEILLRK